MTHPTPTVDDAGTGYPADRTHQWRGRDLAFFGGTFFVLLIIAAIIQTVAGLFVEGTVPELLLALILTLAVELGLLASTYFLVRSVYGMSYREEMRISRDYRISNRSLIVLGVGMALSVLLASAGLTTLYPGLFPEQASPIERLLSTEQTVVIFAIFGILVAPAVEELMFRGFLFRVLQDLIGMSVAVWTTAAIFAVSHGAQLWPNWPSMLVILAVGFVLSKLRERTDSVIPGFIVHTVYNATLFLLFALASAAES